MSGSVPVSQARLTSAALLKKSGGSVNNQRTMSIGLISYERIGELLHEHGSPATLELAVWLEQRLTAGLLRVRDTSRSKSGSWLVWASDCERELGSVPQRVAQAFYHSLTSSVLRLTLSRN